MCRSGLLCWCLPFLALSWVATAFGQAPAPLSNATPALQELGRRAQDTSLPEAERLALVRALGQWGTAQVRQPLMALLKDPLVSIREAAARGLGWEGNREAAAALRERAEAPGEAAGVRAAALDSLGKIGDDSVRDAVLAAVKDPEPQVREAALGALTSGLLAKPGDRFPLLRQLAEDRALDLFMRCEAIRELAKAKDSASSPVFMQLLENEPAVAMPLPGDSASQAEVMALRFREVRDVRAWAAAALGVVEAKEALPLLLKSAEDPDDFFLRVTAVGALVAWNTPAAVPVLVRRLEDPFPDIRAMALVGLGKAGDRSVGDAVLARLADRVPLVRIQAVGALVELGDPRARAELEKLKLTEINPEVHRALEAGLARLAH